MMTPIYEPDISQHALERFCERVADVDHAQAREFIMDDNVKMWLSWGVGKIMNYKGMTFGCQHGSIRTVWVNGA